jgi:threonine/homoserine/homoserine lactone efflux protein
MIPAGHVLAFAAVVTVLIAIPGPSVLFTVSRALTVGRRAALLTVAGNELGLCVQVVAVAFGVGAVVERAAGTARQWLAASPRRLALIGGTSGLVMIGLGVSLAATGRKDGII